jgi:CRP-like cAMP-binding protein
LIAIKFRVDFLVQHRLAITIVTVAMLSTDTQGPAIRALEPWVEGNASPGQMHQLLSDEQRARLVMIASVIQFNKGAEIYHEGDRADALFNITSGVVKACQQGPNDTKHIAAFLFPEDLFGLAQEGRYANSIKTVTPVIAYRIPIVALRSLLLADAALEYHVIAKLCQELRQAQRHAFLLANKRTLWKLAMFLEMLEQLQAARGETANEIYIPMDRSDIADYVGVSLAALSRAFRTLTRLGILQIRDRRHLKVIDRSAFGMLAGSIK